jgi:hypothetical protein
MTRPDKGGRVLLFSLPDMQENGKTEAADILQAGQTICRFRIRGIARRHSRTTKG